MGISLARGIRTLCHYTCIFIQPNFMTKQVRPVPTLSYTRIYARNLLSKLIELSFPETWYRNRTSRPSHNYRYANGALKISAIEVTSASNSRQFCSLYQ